jgi:hypothetical protein
MILAQLFKVRHWKLEVIPTSTHPQFQGSSTAMPQRINTHERLEILERIISNVHHIKCFRHKHPSNVQNKLKPRRFKDAAKLCEVLFSSYFVV